ncbi:MAG: 50S ribosomal protein L18 [Bacteroidota bacterium]|nr:50S ribosomal protein L18 [Bacteroidota bacterium]
MIKKEPNKRRLRIKQTIRKKIFGTTERPRFSVYRSLNEIYGQIIDDTAGKTLLSLSTNSKEVKEELASAKSKLEKSAVVGKLFAKKALDKKITTVVFDRNGYLYHGRVKAFADGAREGGLKF